MQDRFKAFIFAVLGGATTFPVAREFIKSLFWDRVIHFMNPILESGFLLFQDYGIPACFGIAALYFGIGREKLTSLADWAKRRLNLWLVGGRSSNRCRYSFGYRLFLGPKPGSYFVDLGRKLSDYDRALWL